MANVRKTTGREHTVTKGDGSFTKDIWIATHPDTVEQIYILDNLDLLSIPEAAKKLNYVDRHLRAMAEIGVLASRYVGGRLVTSQAACDTLTRLRRDYRDYIVREKSEHERSRLAAREALEAAYNRIIRR